MTSLHSLFDLQFLMFAEMAAGFLLSRIGVIKSSGKSTLSSLAMNLFLPCSIVAAFNMEMSAGRLMGFARILLAAILTEAGSILISRFCYNRIEKGKKEIYQYATVVSNAGFLGNAVAEGVYGAEGLMFGQVCVIPFRIAMWTAGVSYLSPRQDRRKGLLKLLRHPCIIATEIGLLRMIFSIPFPAVIDKTLVSLGRCTTPVIMLFLGVVIAETGFRGIVSRHTVLLSVIRLILIPAAVLLGCRLAGMESLEAGIAVLLAAMPVGSTTAILAQEYGADVEFAADSVAFSTLLSIALLPLWVYLLRLAFPV
ncbi:MAG: AEC family transporter [Lachnospiraceae bacterium]|nr:AEC family transporter [Lachnospiraceae bacterium]